MQFDGDGWTVFSESFLILFDMSLSCLNGCSATPTKTWHSCCEFECKPRTPRSGEDPPITFAFIYSFGNQGQVHLVLEKVRNKNEKTTEGGQKPGNHKGAD
jgi:hypothetical protein